MSRCRSSHRCWAIHLVLVAVLAFAHSGAKARTAGPDVFGYLGTDAVPFAFEDISGTGALTLAGRDDSTFTAPLGFTFVFYDGVFTEVSWSVNGLITLGGTNTGFNNVNFSTGRPIGDKPSIAVLWDDWHFLDPRSVGAFYETRGEPGSRRFIIQWVGAVGTDTNVDPVTFQAILYEGSNSILFQYLDADSGDARSFGAQATVGIRDASGHLNGRNVSWSFNSAVIADGLAIRFGTSLDTSPPAVTVEAPADGTFIGAGEVAVTVRVVDGSETRVVSDPPGLDAALPAGGGTATGTVPLVEGDNAIAISAVDASGNVGGTTIDVVRDTVPPELSGASPLSGSIAGESPIMFSVTVSDATLTTVRFGGLVFGILPPGGLAMGPVALVEGTNGVLVTAADAAGNTSTLAVDLVLDLTAPVVTIDSPRDGECSAAGASLPVVITVDDVTGTDVSSVPAGVSGSLPAGGGVLAGAVPLVEGTNGVSVTASDRSGRSASASVTVRLDTTPPEAVLLSPADGETARGVIDVAAQASDGGCGLSRVDLLLDGELLAAFTGEPFAALLETARIPDGAHLISAVALDAVGNVASVGARILVDNSPPSVSILAPADGSGVSGTVAFTVEASDGSGSGLTVIDVLTNGVPPTTAAVSAMGEGAPTAVLSGLEDTTRWHDGPLTFTATAADGAGNTASASVTVLVTNLVAASLALTPADGSVVSGVFPITVETDGSIGSIEVFADEVSLGSSASSPFRAEFDSTKRLDGALTIVARVRDAAGRMTEATAVVTIDNLSVHVIPSSLNLGHKGSGVFLMLVEGPSARLIRLLEKGLIELRVPGGSPAKRVKVLGPAHKVVLESRARRLDRFALLLFDRAELIASIRAGIAAGSIDPEAGAEIGLVADGCLIGTAILEIRESRRR
jgi:hypothetical protein